jgi:hypothetical protein
VLALTVVLTALILILILMIFTLALNSPSMSPWMDMQLTLDNLQAGLVSRVGALPLPDLRAQLLADALRNGGAVNLGGRHPECCA